ncbi:exodeoxyribonuclease VII large subunit, partial [Klebsiella pneumoniae]|nr:exodeoxyribonuclease VII large subunit [Klebsiella pneumoniae]
PFSDEALVRAVYATRTPVVSAIGHDRDNPILDLVADLRASTPTDAGKLIVPDAAEQSQAIETARAQLRQAVTRFIDVESG